MDGGDAITIEYKFKKNYNYRIVINGGVHMDIGNVNNVLQMQMTNNPVYGQNCAYNNTNFDLSNTTNPFASLSVQDFSSPYADIGYAIVNLTSSDCYDFLWLSSLSPANSLGVATIRQIVIEETSPLSITGSQICSLPGTSQYTLNNVPAQSIVSWVSSNTNFATVFTVGNPITVNGLTNGQTTLTATTSICGNNISTTAVIPIGTGASSINFTQRDITCENTKPYFYGAVAEIASATNYAWYAKDMSNASNPFVLKQSENSNTADFPLGNNHGNRYYTIRVIVTTPCGNVQSIDAEGYTYAPLCSSGSRVVTSPNPSSNLILVKLLNEQEQISDNKNDKIYELQLTDKFGVVLKTLKFKGGIIQTTLSLNELHTDVYILRVWNGKEWISTKLVKN